MAIKFNCDCGRELNVKDELAGKKGKCPTCGRIVEVPTPGKAYTIEAKAEDIVVPAAKPEVETKPCIHCGKPLPVAAVFCTNCGTHLRTGKKQQVEGTTEGEEEYNFFKVAPDLLTRPMEAVGVIVEAPLSVKNLKKALILLAVGMVFFAWVVPLNNDEAMMFCHKPWGSWGSIEAFALAVFLGLVVVLTDAIICNIAGSMFGTTGVEFASMFMAILSVRALVGLAMVPFWIYGILPGTPLTLIMAWFPRAIRLLWGTFLMYCVILRSYECGVVPALVFAAGTTVAQAILFWLPGLIFGIRLI